MVKEKEDMILVQQKNLDDTKVDIELQGIEMSRVE
jgi:hypothetical protein